MPSCKSDTQKTIAIIWEGKRAKAIAIPKNILIGSANGDIENTLKIYVGTNKLMAVLGEYKVDANNIVIKPLVPLSPALTYNVFYNHKIIGSVKVPPANVAEAPQLLAVYPTPDTLPENLLKIYLEFSGPMREGEALKHIALLDQNSDTVPGIFLDLQPELWNNERTVLTLWLDPGRIKRDLMPNQQLGNPLQMGKRYTLAISNAWRDVQGLPLQQSFTKNFFVTGRDETSPAINQWKLIVPNAGTTLPLIIQLNEALDYFLLQEDISIVDKNGKTVEGKTEVSDKERMLRFTPANNWQAGTYRVVFDPVLEDMAGNNLSRPFDRDLQVKNANETKSKFEVSFRVK